LCHHLPFAPSHLYDRNNRRLLIGVAMIHRSMKQQLGYGLARTVAVPWRGEFRCNQNREKALAARSRSMALKRHGIDM
jgi:hypothetical protein